MMNLAWTYLLAAGLFEIGWPVGLKMAQTPRKTIAGIILAVACMVISGYLLYLGG
jgi:quaternary ammonium compound-resistance protein SugE